jgi:hypothetical protein
VCLAWFWIAKWVCIAWQWVFHIFCSGDGGAPFLLTDGSVLLNETNSGVGTRRWWKLAPDSMGNYAAGIWTRMADSLQARKYVASAVLADGRLLVIGGEYTDASGTYTQDWSNTGEIYNPQTNTWTVITTAPVTQIGDAACSLIPDGRFLVGDLQTRGSFIYDPNADTWTAVANKAGRSNEESWVLMPEGSVLTVETLNAPNAEKYDIAANAWRSAGSLVADITETASSEIGPAVLLPDARVFCVGANAGRTAVYTPGATVSAAGTWAAGPTLPLGPNRQAQGAKDGPGCLLITGSVLFPIAPVDGSQNNFLSPCTFYEFDGTNVNRVSDPSNADCPTYYGRLLLLPTGQVLWSRENSGDMSLYTVNGSFNTQWRPVITSVPNILVPGSTIDVVGTQFNGLSQAVGYGDDYTAATNYPLMRLTHAKTGVVRYCRTSNHRIVTPAGTTTSMGVATGNTPVTTTADIPANLPLGEYRLEIIANGIPSEAATVTVRRDKG